LAWLARVNLSLACERAQDPRHAIIGLFIDNDQDLLLVIVFYVMFGVFNMRGAADPGDFLLYIMSGKYSCSCVPYQGR